MVWEALFVRACGWIGFPAEYQVKALFIVWTQDFQYSEVSFFSVRLFREVVPFGSKIVVIMSLSASLGKEYPHFHLLFLF